MSDRLSFYMLVKNSEQYLDLILSRISTIADEIILLDSGSHDQTRHIAAKWPAQWHSRALDNFRNQRSHALSLCRYRYVLFLDADEIPDEALLQHIQSLKQTGFDADAYCLRREWQVLGHLVHSVYPIHSPDFPVRLVNKNKVSFANSSRVHEDYGGYERKLILSGKILHHTFQSRAEIRQKLNFYSTIAAEDLREKKKPFHFYKMIFNPVSAWIKWYFLKEGWKDGVTGVRLANYALLYTFLKYRKYRASMKSHGDTEQKITR